MVSRKAVTLAPAASVGEIAKFFGLNYHWNGYVIAKVIVAALSGKMLGCLQQYKKGPRQSLPDNRAVVPQCTGVVGF